MLRHQFAFKMTRKRKSKMKKTLIVLSLLCFPTLGFADFTSNDCSSAGNAYADALGGFCGGSTVATVSNVVMGYRLPDNLTQMVISAAKSDAEAGKCDGASLDNAQSFSQQCVNLFATK